MSSAIIVAKNQDCCDTIANIVKNCDFVKIDTVLTGLEARAKFTYNSFDLLVIYAPLNDEFGLELIADIRKISSVAIVVITKNDISEEVQKKSAFANAFVVSRPINKQALMQAIRYVMVVKEQIEKLTVANDELEQKFNDLKLIDRAKCVLIQYLRISEAQAHRHIQKQAMDQRLPQVAIAKDILKTYES